MTDAYLMPGPVLISVEVERSIDALDPDRLPENAGLVALARLYALTLHESGPTQNALKEIGPKLTAVLVALGKRGSAAALPAPAELPAVDPAPAELQAARADPSSPAAVLDLERARVEKLRRRGAS